MSAESRKVGFYVGVCLCPSFIFKWHQDSPPGHFKNVPGEGFVRQRCRQTDREKTETRLYVLPLVGK